ncbi:WD domain repeat-containing protein 55 [Chytriomyces hyalinus]|nr:WD domain repeat-containing protein 55 [Chytriomyces hyalinus]
MRTELFSGGEDKSLQILDSATGKPILKKAKAHGEPINCISAIAENMVVTGDDAGVVKIWDTRARKLVMKYEVNEDFISDLTYVSHESTLLATSADGRLSVFDIRKKKPIKVSDNQEDELLSVTVLKNTKKAVVGSEDGILSIFSWNNWGDCTDRIPGHPGAIESILKMDESRILTGCSDGKVRIVNIFPNKIVSSLRDHDVDLPIEQLRINADATIVASVSHEDKIRLWDVSDLGTEAGDGDSDDDDEFESDDAGSSGDESVPVAAADNSDDADEASEAEEPQDSKTHVVEAKIVVPKLPELSTGTATKRESDQTEPTKKAKKVKKVMPNAKQTAYFGDLD